MRSLRLVLVALAIGLVPSLVSAQPPVTGGNTLVWDQPNTTAAAAAAMTYRYYPDGSATGIGLSGVTCAGTTTVTCQAAFPAFTPGPHSLTIAATNTAGEGPKSAAFSFSFVVLPSAPVNVRIGS